MESGVYWFMQASQSEEITSGQWQIDPTDAEAFARVIEQASGKQRRGVSRRRAPFGI